MHVRPMADCNCTPGAIRTRGLLLRRQTLYPAELRAQFVEDKLTDHSCHGNGEFTRY
jgi:hypothetical protein